MIALLDSDIICYRVSAMNNDNPAEEAHYYCDQVIRDILQATGSTEYIAFLGGSDNFRKQIYPEYKAHRTAPKPKWLESCREHLVVEWKAQLSDGIETDDEIGLAATKYWNEGVPFVVASIDKDLKQLPGKHYNFVKKEFAYVTPMEGYSFFWKQMLIGDSADNIKGVVGIGEKKAKAAIDPLSDEKDMHDLVLSLYNDKERFNLNAQLLWILKHERNPQESLLHFQSLLEQGQDTEQFSSLSLEPSQDLGLDATPQMETLLSQ